MPVLLKNSIFDTQRSIFSPATGVTAQPTTYLRDQVGRIAQLSVADYTFLPEGALKSEFSLNVDMATDVQIGDLLINIRLNDGVTSWLVLSANESWKVYFIHPTPPGFMANKRCFIGRYTGGGPATT